MLKKPPALWRIKEVEISLQLGAKYVYICSLWWQLNAFSLHCLDHETSGCKEESKCLLESGLPSRVVGEGNGPSLRTPLPGIFLSNVRLLCNNWTKFSYRWGATETFLHPPLCASRRRGSVEQCRTLRSSWQASSCSQQTLSSPARRRVEESVSTPTAAGATM